MGSILACLRASLPLSGGGVLSRGVRLARSLSGDHHRTTAFNEPREPPFANVRRPTFPPKKSRRTRWNASLPTHVGLHVLGFLPTVRLNEGQSLSGRRRSRRCWLAHPAGSGI